MNRAAVAFLVLVFGVSLSAGALTGSGHSAGPLDTVHPAVLSVTTPTSASLSVTLSEPMLAPADTTTENYTVSGTGKGTLAAHPDTVTGTGPYTLTWSAGEMRDGAPLTVTVSGLQDSPGNPISAAADNAQCLGRGVLPTFSNLSAAPAEAAVGGEVTLKFTASESLVGDPDLTVNGHAASFVSGIGNVYTLTYVIQDTDTPGMAAITVSGFDLAGNLGVLNSGDGLKVLAESGMPLHAWPAVVMLLAAGVFFLRRLRKSPAGATLKGRGVFFLLALFTVQALLCPAAFAAPPTVSNVNFTQGPNGAAATQVDIYYDLDAPNGPCGITVSLSKDGGADGFSFPVTAITGDLADLSTGTGYHIVWDIAADYPDQDLPLADIRVTAEDGLVQHTLTYTAEAGGSISGISSQTVNHNASGEAVTAVPDTGHYFVQWSDASTQNPRTDENVTGDVTVAAVFAAYTYTLTYAAETNGAISGTSPQTVDYGESGTEVTAVPDTGYYFVQWSDASTQNPRTDANVTGDVTVTASFAVSTYTLTYAAEANGTISGISPQTVDYGESGAEVTAVPDAGHYFVRWSDASTQNPRTDTNVTADIAVTASFATYSYTLTYGVSGGNGTLAGTTTQTVDYNASGSAVTAVPDFGYMFLQWSDASTQNPRTDTNVTADINVSASFGPAMQPLPQGAFMMGSSGVGDDLTWGEAKELPAHPVTLSAYQIGKYPVTNRQYCEVLNWALAQGYLKTSAGAAWTGTDSIYAGGNLQIILNFADELCNIRYSDGAFSSKTRPGLPVPTNYSMDMHPVEDVSWFGAAAFCNWLSQMKGMTPCYDMTKPNWPLTVAPPTPGGYRLPTEAEWERAAAWDGTKHWVYGFTSDTNSGATQCNDHTAAGTFVNPLGLTEAPYTSPVGWFDGTNVSPNGGIRTVNSVSPAGAYDMSGNVFEWCGDWHSGTYYSGGAMTNPTGPTLGMGRVHRGGGWTYDYNYSRTAYRFFGAPTITTFSLGFRLARS